MAKTKAEVAKMVRAQKIKQFSKLTLEQRKIKNGEIMRSARKDTAVGKIELSVLKKLILPEQKANKARTELKKTVPTTKKKVTRAELDKARVALQKKPVPKGSHRMPDGSIMKDSAMPKKKPAPNSIGQKNLQELLRLGDLSGKISKEAKSQGTYLASIDNLLVFADGDKMKTKIENAVKGNRGLENYGLAVYEVKAGDTIANIRLIASTDYSKFWLPDGEQKAFDSVMITDDTPSPHSDILQYVYDKGTRVKGFMTGKRYKHLKSWNINKGIPHFNSDKPSWWDSGREKKSDERGAKRDAERNELREKAIKLTIPKMKEFIKNNFYLYPFLSKMKKADLIKEIKTNDTWKTLLTS